jgi:hypothetical protein
MQYDDPVMVSSFNGLRDLEHESWRHSMAWETRDVNDIEVGNLRRCRYFRHYRFGIAFDLVQFAVSCEASDCSTGADDEDAGSQRLLLNQRHSQHTHTR